MRAQVVLPTPRGPQKRKAWASWLFLIAFFRVVVICAWPTTVEKFCGLYFLAETINLSIPRTKLEKRLFKGSGFKPLLHNVKNLNILSSEVVDKFFFRSAILPSLMFSA